MAQLEVRSLMFIGKEKTGSIPVDAIFQNFSKITSKSPKIFIKHLKTENLYTHLIFFKYLKNCKIIYLLIYR